MNVVGNKFYTFKKVSAVTALSGAALVLLVAVGVDALKTTPCRITTHHSTTGVTVADLSLDQKIGQLVIAGFDAPYLDTTVNNLVTQKCVGGLNLLKRNVASADQVRALTAQLQSLSEIPLFIATDQEGGRVIRFDFLKEKTLQSDILTEQDAEQKAFQRAVELKGLGITMNLAPVAEYVSDPASYMFDRTFETSPEQAAALARAMAVGYRRGGMVSVAKHFPGYGNSSANPHVEESFSGSTSTLNANLISFGKVTASGGADAIMVAHVIIPEIDTKPASRSAVFLTHLLRTKMGFTGVIMTDDVGMAAVGESAGQAAVDAIDAGADMIVASMASSEAEEVISAIKNSVLSGHLSEQRIDESVERILKLKDTL